MIYSNQFIDTSLIDLAGLLDSAKLVWDHWHLRNGTLPKKFGVFYFNRMKNHLQRMLNAHTAADSFDEAYGKARLVIQNDHK